MNSCVPVALEWHAEGRERRWETQTIVVGLYGCLVVLAENLDINQPVRITNLSSLRSSAGIVVWRGSERPEGWEFGIELIKPDMGFWGVEL